MLSPSMDHHISPHSMHMGMVSQLIFTPHTVGFIKINFDGIYKGKIGWTCVEESFETVGVKNYSSMYVVAG